VILARSWRYLDSFWHAGRVPCASVPKLALLRLPGVKSVLRIRFGYDVGLLDSPEFSVFESKRLTVAELVRVRCSHTE
jgi:hypothetical protein